jgi:hypothetical protein
MLRDGLGDISAELSDLTLSERPWLAVAGATRRKTVSLREVTMFWKWVKMDWQVSGLR